MSEDIARLQRRADRERAARKEAERLLEDKSRELWEANRRLASWNRQLEAEVESRTEELRRALAQAEEHSLAKSRFLAMMSHEIRTPLHGILGMTEVLDQTDLDAQQHDYTRLIRSSGGHLLTLVNDILDLSRVESGQLVLEHRPFSLRAELERIIDMIRIQAEDGGLELHLRLAPDMPDWVSGDATRIRQILINVVANAVKFTPAGSVTLAARRASPRYEGDSAVEIDVEDTGIGLPESAGTYLFEPFEQGDSSTSRRYGGSGLGLSIARRLLAEMGGVIDWTSQPGVGTTFRITLPLREVEAPSPLIAAASCRDCVVGDRLRVLVVDDVDVNRLVPTRLAQRMGHSADAAADGASAVAMVAEGAYDVVFLDVRMPGMDGLAVARAIRGLPLDRQPYIVAMTAGAFTDDERECRDAGMDDFLPKPFQVEELRSLLCARCVVSAGD